jgi:hypothetical protein
MLALPALILTRPPSHLRPLCSFYPLTLSKEMESWGKGRLLSGKCWADYQESNEGQPGRARKGP